MWRSMLLKVKISISKNSTYRLWRSLMATCASVPVLPLSKLLSVTIPPQTGREYFKAALVIVPLRVGGSLKIKIIEALSHVRPCVTTNIGAQGLVQGDNEPLIVEDEAVAFAAAVIELLKNNGAQNRLATAAHQACIPFSTEVAFAPLIERGL